MWNCEIKGQVTTFGVFGMLYHENLMPYDRNMGSVWSLMRMECVHGTYIGEKPKILFTLKTRSGSKKLDFTVAFLKNSVDFGSVFSSVQNDFPVILKDNRGNRFDVFGEAIEGPSRGKRLEPALSFTAKDWTWETFYPDANIFSE